MATDVPPAPVDQENPAEPPQPSADEPLVRFASERHAAAAKFLRDASASGRLGSGPAEPGMEYLTSARLLLTTVPWTVLTVQLVWSGIVLGIVYALRPTNPDGSNKFSSLSVDFWTSKLGVGSTISYGVGWALFVLLGFFIHESNARYVEGLLSIENAMSHGRQLLRQMRQVFPAGSWHAGDHDRMVAHITALPIALKMTLRGERERAQLEPILHPDDVTDVVEADLMYIQCTRVLRAYINTIEDDSSFCFPHSTVESTTGCFGARFLVLYLVDAIESSCNAAVRIAQFRPSFGYVSHLHNFLYIWFFFLPLVLVQSSGWFTPIWSILITYFVRMLFTIAATLNEPFRFHIPNIKLNRISADWAYQILSEHSTNNLCFKEAVLQDHETPTWLEKPIQKNEQNIVKNENYFIGKMQFWNKMVGRSLGTWFVVKNLSIAIAWTAFIIFLTWGLTKDNEMPREPSDRWLSLYLPISTTTTGFISLGVFLLLGFWMNDAYARYWNCLQLWNCKIKPGIEGTASLCTLIHRQGFWHTRDRERLLSFFVAYAYSVKQHLRQSRDVSELEGTLDARDLHALSQAPHLPNHCLNVIFGYINSAESVDPDTVQGKEVQFGWDIYTVVFKLMEVENATTKCNVTRKYPISRSFTLHLFLYVAFWLALLPLSLLKENGFFIFIFNIPVAYAIINLLSIGLNLSDPFGLDAEDIPMDRICADMKNSIHSTYHENRGEVQGYMREETYNRARFSPLLGKPNSTLSDEEYAPAIAKANLLMKNPVQCDEAYTLRTLARGLFDQLPDVDRFSQIAATLWSIAAVFISWRLSKISDEWADGSRGGCREWCSPIDVDGDILTNIGYALFMLLSFRASDALGRYEDGAQLVYELKVQLRSSAVDFIQTFRQDHFHANDRERFIAHLVQIPLLVRDRLLQGAAFSPVSDDTILSPNDQRRMAESADPFEHVLRTLESYVIVLDRPNQESFTSEPLVVHQMTLMEIANSCQAVREIYASMLSVKTFPVIRRYSKHQLILTALWLGLLPLFMTRDTGFFTILWAPLISYGIFSLQSITEKLVDPFGDDTIDIPVKRMLTEISEEILATVEAHDWDRAKYTRPSPLGMRPSIGTRLVNGDVEARWRLAHFEEHEATIENFGKSPLIEFESSGVKKLKPNLLLHLVNSVPWWALISIVTWTVVGCVISYITRDRNATDVRWWKSGISVSTNVATFVSFVAFMLLGFYVQAAFRRYMQAGAVWGGNLRVSCHALTVCTFNLFQDGYVHEKDQERIIAHIAAIPLVLKNELRQSRDLRELNGLLSFEDIARIQAAPNMTTHCADVYRSYLNTANHHQEKMTAKPVGLDSRNFLPVGEIKALETTLRSASFLNEFDIAPGFIVLLNALLAIWFLLLPFVLAEVSGWFTILWVAIIAYGVLGLYTVAAELQSPFGLDVNDLDLDKIADFIVRDVLFIQKNYKAGTKVLTRPSQPVGIWNSDAVVENKNSSFSIHKNEAKARSRLGRMKLIAQTVSPKRMIFNALCATGSVLLAYGTSKWFPFAGGACTSQWFCTYIAMGGSLQEFIGFALFLLLGFRLYDSHGRYEKAIRLWQDEIIGGSRILTVRILYGIPPGSYHVGDVDRICGHIAAFGICVMGALRGNNYEEKLSQVVSAEDVKRILSARDRIDYCLDVVRAYLFEMAWRVILDGVQPCGYHERLMMESSLRSLAQSAYECRGLVRIPLPFGYVEHMKIFLYIWMLLLPLGLVEETGWLTILWVVIIEYGVFGAVHWAEELSDPFGYEVSDVPLDAMCDRMIAEVKDTHSLLAARGTGAIMHPNRSGFSG